MIERPKLTQKKPAKLPKPCKYCGGLGHLAFGCTKKPRKPLKAKKPMRKIGKVGRSTMASNKAFLDSKQDDELYCAYCLYCDIEELLPRTAANAEHFYSRARHPEMRLDRANLVISCPAHNRLKGSLDGPEFLALLDKEKSLYFGKGTLTTGEENGD